MPEKIAVSIRSMELEDARAVARVQIETWRSTYTGLMPQDFLDAMDLDKSEAKWRESMLAGDALVRWVACRGSEIIGYLVGGKNREEETSFDAELIAIYVTVLGQRSGAGTKLVSAFVSWCRDQGYRSFLLWVLAGNRPSRTFYEKKGGKLLGLEKDIVVGGAPLRHLAYGWQI